jgi:hypothetical protein
MNKLNKLESLNSSPSLTQVLTSSLYYKYMTIVNDDSSAVSKWRSKLWCHIVMLLEVSLMLLQSSIMVIVQTSYMNIVIYNCHTFIAQATLGCIDKTSFSS